MNVSSETLRELKDLYKLISREIEDRLREFREAGANADSNKVFEELSFCILSSGVGPRMAQKSIEAMGEHLHSAGLEELTESLKDAHKYPDKAGYLVTTREYLRSEFNYDLYGYLSAIGDRIERRDFIADNKSIKGIGMVQASHFLRNIGFFGYAILDRNIISSLYEFGVLGDSKPASTKRKYIEKENLMIDFSDKLSISIDELDLLLWYRKNGKIPR